MSITYIVVLVECALISDTLILLGKVRCHILIVQLIRVVMLVPIAGANSNLHGCTRSACTASLLLCTSLNSLLSWRDLAALGIFGSVINVAYARCVRWVDLVAKHGELLLIPRWVWLQVLIATGITGVNSSLLTRASSFATLMTLSSLPLFS